MARTSPAQQSAERSGAGARRGCHRLHGRAGGVPRVAPPRLPAHRRHRPLPAGPAPQDIYPRYRVPLELAELDLDGPHGDVEAAIVAYPHAAAAPTVAALRERGVRVIDLSADYRLRSLEHYQHWYGEHPRPDLMAEAVYGLTELHREAIRGASLVANPGCYPDRLAAGARAARARGRDR